MKSRLIIKTSTWQRDSHGLFDYEGKETDKKQIKAVGTCKQALYFQNFWISASYLYIVSLMRHEVQVEVKYDEEDDKLEESKEEET